MATRLYSSISIETTLGGTINNSTTSITVANGTASALLGGVVMVANSQFTVAIDPDTINEEIVFITAGPSGNTFTVSRGQAGTGVAGVTGVAHSTGATIRHVLTSDDLTAFAAGISPVSSFAFSGSTSGTTTVQATAVAGTNTLSLPATTSDTLAGIAATQTLSNKTLTAPKITLGYSAKTAAYTLASGDESYLFSMNNAATAQFNIPTDATFNFAIGTQISFVWITGAGQPTIGATTPATTTVISNAAVSATPKLRVVNSAATAIKLAANSWLVVGDIA
jgi:hypothetical protein